MSYNVLLLACVGMVVIKWLHVHTIPIDMLAHFNDNYRSITNLMTCGFPIYYSSICWLSVLLICITKVYTFY